jgi:signal transduction histidine kinase
VWFNYISNALKYGGERPRVELGVEVKDAADAASNMACFWVRDDGPGIAPEDQARLFTPFERLGQARTEGHGLGLSIVQRIVKRLDGEVGVDSRPGGGSTFYFTLPTNGVTAQDG